MPRIVHALADQLTDSQRSLIEANREYAWRLAMRGYCWMVQRLGTDEARSAVDAGVVEAARRFDPERGRAFITYAMFWVRSRLQDAVRAIDRQPVALDSERCPEPAADDRPPSVEDIDAADRVNALLRVLPERYQAVLRMTLAGMSYREVGERLGCGKERVRQLRNKALERLRALVRARMGTGDWGWRRAEGCWY